MFTFLSLTGNKVRAKLAEVQSTLKLETGVTAPLEVNFKFVDEKSFKEEKQDDQKAVLLNVVAPNFEFFIKSLLPVYHANPAVRDGVSLKVKKFLWRYDPQNTVADNNGFPSWLTVKLNGDTLEIITNQANVKQNATGQWNVAPKIIAAFGSSSSSSSSPAPTAVASPPPQVVVQHRPTPNPTPTPTPVHVSSPSASSSSGSPSLARRNKIGGDKGGKGEATFLYMALDKVKKQMKVVAEQFTAKIGRPDLTVEIDFQFVKEVPFINESQADQKDIMSLTGPVISNFQSCLLDSNNCLATAFLVPVLKDQVVPKLKKVKLVYASSGVTSAHGVNYVDVVYPNESELHLRIATDFIDEYKQPQWCIELKAFEKIPSPSSSSPAQAASPAPVASHSSPVVSKPVQQTPSRPAVSSPQISSPTPSTSQPSSPAPVASGPVGFKRVGGNPGGNGTATFCYMNIDKLKKKCAELTGQLTLKVGRHVTVDMDWLFTKNPQFTGLSEADQKAILVQCVLKNLPDIILGDESAESIISKPAAQVKDIVSKIKTVRVVYIPDVFSEQGCGYVDINFTEDGNELQIRVELLKLDEPKDSSWKLNAKAVEAVGSVEKRKAAQQRVLDERARIDAEKVLLGQQAAMAEERAKRDAASLKAAEDAKKLEQELASSKAQRQANLEEVYNYMQPHEKRLGTFVGKKIKLEIDDIFFDDRKLRWKELGFQKTLLKNIVQNDIAIFPVAADALIAIVEHPTGKKLVDKDVESVRLKFFLNNEVNPSMNIPAFNYIAHEKCLMVVSTFSNLYDPKLWVAQATSPTYRPLTTHELMYSYVAEALGILNAVCREDLTVRNQKLADDMMPKSIKKSIPVDLDWATMEAKNASLPPYQRLLRYYEVADNVTLQFLESLAGANRVVKEILQKSANKLLIRIADASTVYFKDTEGLIKISVDTKKFRKEPKFYKETLEDAVRNDCSGLTVKNVAPEISMAEAEATIAGYNSQLSSFGMKPCFRVDYAKFVDEPAFLKQFYPKYDILYKGHTAEMPHILKGLQAISKTVYGREFVKKINAVVVVVEPVKPASVSDPKMKWDAGSGTLTIIQDMTNMSAPPPSLYHERMEFAMGILEETARRETQATRDSIIQSIQSHFKTSVPVIVDEAYQKSPQYLAMHPKDMRILCFRGYTEMLKAAFDGAKGVFRCAEFTEPRKVLHDKIKSIKLIIDANKTKTYYGVEVNGTELVVRCGFDTDPPVEACGHDLTGLLNLRGMIEKSAIAEVDPKIAQRSSELSRAVGTTVTITVNWSALIADASFKQEHEYVATIRSLDPKVNVALQGDKLLWDRGLIQYVSSKPGLKAAMQKVKVINIVIDTSNSVTSPGLFTPKEYNLSTLGGAGDVTMKMNKVSTSVGCGANWEKLLTPDVARNEETAQVDRLEVYRREKERRRRHDEMNDIIETNNRNMSNYNHDHARWLNGHRRHAPTYPTAHTVPYYPELNTIDFRLDCGRKDLHAGVC